MPTPFTPASLAFLRSLARHNDREWFTPRKPIYERELKAPMFALIEQLNHALAAFAPDHIRPPHKAMLRIYRDTRFDASRGTPKRPYKTHLAAWFGPSGPRLKAEKTSAAGFYLHIGPTETVIAAGIYRPTPAQLLALRRHIAAHPAQLASLLANRKLRAALPDFKGNPLTRPPRGFSTAPAAAQPLLLNRQFGLSISLPAQRALAPGLLRDIVSRFALAAPLVHLLNGAIAPPPAS